MLARRAPAFPLAALAFLLYVAAAATCGDSGDGLEIKTDRGCVQGVENEGSRQWLGIPYAWPPVGSLRFAPPQPPAPWDDVKPCLEFGPFCHQNGTTHGPQSEDCLSLNVFAPPVGAGALATAVFVHGGGFVWGGSGARPLGAELGPIYDGATLAKLGICVVTINYRLGPLGFIAHAGLGNVTNVGLQDQQAALRWVQRNIAAFGCVSAEGGAAVPAALFGESAGAFSTFAHLVAPGSKGLFQRAVMESGSWLKMGNPSLADGKRQSTALAAAVGCSNSDAAAELECLRAQPAARLDAFGTRGSCFFGKGAMWWPIIGGPDLPGEPLAMVRAGATLNAAEVIVGHNRNEGTLFADEYAGFGKKLPVADYAPLVNKTFAPFFAQIDIERMLQQYAPDGDDAKPALAALAGDMLLACPGRAAAQALGARGTAVWTYEFDHVLDILRFLPYVHDLGVFHSSELGFLFQGPKPAIPDLFVPGEHELSGRIGQRWASFFSRGVPSATAGGAADDWPQYAWPSKAPETLSMNVPKDEALVGVQKAACDFWDNIPDGKWPPEPPLGR